MPINEFKNFNDNAALGALGRRLAAARLNRDQTQAALAHEAGVSRRSVSKVENGHVVDTRVLIRILHALELLDGLERLFPDMVASPVALAQARGKSRERASGQRRENDGATPPEKGFWTWPQT